MMKKFVAKNAEVVDPTASADVVRKLYSRKDDLFRTCVDCVRKLDQSTKDAAGNINRLLLADHFAVRTKLQDSCEQLIFINPVEYGRRAEDLIWRKCFYEPLTILRHHKEKLSSDQLSSAITLLHSGLGYYLQFLCRLQQHSTTKLDAEVFNFLHASLPWNASKPISSKITSDQKWIAHCAVRSLIYLGDLARYQREFDDNASEVLAELYYSMAAKFRPEAGMPYNQLGTLFTNQNYGCDSVFFYLRCLLSVESFDGAQGNLTIILKKNENYFNEINQEGAELILQTRQSYLKKFIVSFLHVCFLFFEDVPLNDKGDQLSVACQSVLELFDRCLIYLSTSCNDAILPLSELPLQLLLRMVGIQIMLVKKLQGKGSSKVSSAIALILAMFSHLLRNTLLRLQRKLFRADDLLLSSEADSAAAINGCTTSHDEQPSEVNEPEISQAALKKKAELPILRRRRRGSESDDSEGEERGATGKGSLSSGRTTNGNGDSEREVVSENEESVAGSDEDNDSEKLDDVNDDETEGVDSEERDRRRIILSNRNVPLEITKADDVDAIFASRPLSVCSGRADSPSNAFVRLSQTDLDDEVPTALLGQEANSVPFKDQTLRDQLDELAELAGLLPIKILLDWLKCNSNLLVSIGESSQAVWHSLIELLNFLPKEDAILNFVKADSYLHKKLSGVVWAPVADWTQQIPLTEDFSFYGLSSLAQIHNAVDFTKPSVTDRFTENIIRIFAMKSFGHFLVRLNIPGLKYDRARQEFMAPLSGKTTMEEVRSEEAEAKREALLKNMAKLRLQLQYAIFKLRGFFVKDEMEQLQSKGWIPVYLVPTSTAVANELQTVKLLAATQKFIVVIPNIVVQQLDDQKKASVFARDAIRFLEAEFSKGTKFLRAHKETDDAGTNGVNLGDISSRNLRELLNCATQLRSTVKGSASSSCVVCILCGQADSAIEMKIIEDFLTTCDGISLCNVQDFFKRWKAYSKKRG